MRKWTFLSPFLAQFLVDLDAVWSAAMTCWCVQAPADFCSMIYFHGNELYLHYFEKTLYKIGLCLDAYELIFFKLGMMIDMTKLYILIPVLMTLTVIQGHRVMKNLEPVQSFCCEAVLSCPNTHSG